MDTQRSGFSISPIFPVIIVIAVLTYFFGWLVLLGAAALTALTVAGVYLHDRVSHDRKCPECHAARAHVLSSHPEWDVWIEKRSHRANLDERAVVAIFYQQPDRISRPAPYKLFSVEYGNAVVTELDKSQGREYCLTNYK
jgi:hypothetical protein